MRPQHTIRTFRNDNIRNRLKEIQRRFDLKDEARQILHNEIEAAARYWFIQGGGNEKDFEIKFNGLK